MRLRGALVRERNHDDVTMMYVGYPNLNSSEILAHAAPLQATDRLLPLSTAWKSLPAEEQPTAINLSKIAGQS